MSMCPCAPVLGHLLSAIVGGENFSNMICPCQRPCVHVSLSVSVSMVLVFYSTFCPTQRFVSFNVLYHSAFFPFGVFPFNVSYYLTFCPIRRFFPVDVLSHVAFFPFNILSHSAFCLLTFCRSTFFTFGICYFDILSVNRIFCRTSILYEISGCSIGQISSLKYELLGFSVEQISSMNYEDLL
jgi:hypothetical protein